MNISSTTTKVAIEAAAAGLGAVAAGPLGGALGGMVARVYSGPMAEVITKFAEKFGEEAGKQLLDEGKDSLLDQMKDSPASLTGVYREALRLALAAIQPEVVATEGEVFADWFRNWDFCLSRNLPLDLERLKSEMLLPANRDLLFAGALERLDGQGSGMQKSPPTIRLSTRPLPEALRVALVVKLPEALEGNFSALIVKENYGAAWKQAELVFQDKVLGRLDELGAAAKSIAADTAMLPGVAAALAATRADAASAAAGVAALLKIFETNVAAGRVTQEQVQAKDQEIARMADELRKLHEQLDQRQAESSVGDGSAEKLAKLLKAGDIEGAAQWKAKELETRRLELKKLPQDYFEMGLIRELQFDWAGALEAFREAWRLDPTLEYGFKYGFRADQQNRADEAIAVFEALRTRDLDPLTKSMVLNNLGNFYREVQRFDGAREALEAAVDIRRGLAKEDPHKYEPQLADALNNLANLLKKMGKFDVSEKAYLEGLKIYGSYESEDRTGTLAAIARMMNNLGNLYAQKRVMDKAETSFGRAISIRALLAKSDPKAYETDLAESYCNLATFYCEQERKDPLGKAEEQAKAERLYLDALSIQRRYAQGNPEAHGRAVARTLNNLGALYRDLKKPDEAEKAYVEARKIYQELGKTNYGAYAPDIADVQSNLGVVYAVKRDFEKALKEFEDAVTIRRGLAKTNAQAFGADLAVSLNNLASYYRDRQEFDKGLPLCVEAEQTIEPLWETNAAMYGNTMGRVLLGKALISKELGAGPDEVRTYLQRGLNAALDGRLRGSLQWYLDHEG